MHKRKAPGVSVRAGGDGGDDCGVFPPDWKRRAVSSAPAASAPAQTSEIGGGGEVTMAWDAGQQATPFAAAASAALATPSSPTSAQPPASPPPPVPVWVAAGTGVAASAGGPPARSRSLSEPPDVRRTAAAAPPPCLALVPYSNPTAALAAHAAAADALAGPRRLLEDEARLRRAVLAGARADPPPGTVAEEGRPASGRAGSGAMSDASGGAMMED